MPESEPRADAPVRAFQQVTGVTKLAVAERDGGTYLFSSTQWIESDTTVADVLGDELQ